MFYLVPHFSHFCAYFVVGGGDLAVSNGPSCSAEAFLSVSRLRGSSCATMCIDALCSGMSSGTVGHDFNVNESTMYIN